MKFVVILVIHLLIGVECGKLSREENLKRIGECGKIRLPQLIGTAGYYEGRPIAIEKNHWIVSVRATHSDGKEDEASGVFISPRHILTSSQALFDGNMAWHWGKQKVDRTAWCRNDKWTVGLDAKDTNGKDLVEISSGFCTKKADCVTPGVQNYTAVNIWLPDFCSSRTADGFPQMRSLMIVEVKPIATQTYACLVNKKDPDFSAQARGNAYGIEKAENQPSQMLFRKPYHFSYHDPWITVPKYWSTGDRGGPLIKIINERSVIMGIGASTGHWDRATQTYFYNMKQYLDVVCTATGICPRPKDPIITRAPMVRTTKPPKPPKPPTKKPPTKKPPTKKPRPTVQKTRPTVPPTKKPPPPVPKTQRPRPATTKRPITKPRPTIPLKTTTVVPTMAPTTTEVLRTTFEASEAPRAPGATGALNSTSEASEATESFNSTSEATFETLEPSESAFGNETSIDNSTETNPSKPWNPTKPPVTQKPKSKPGKPEKLEKPKEAEEEEEYGYEEDFIVTEDFFDNATDNLMLNCLSVLLSVVLILINV